MRWPAAPTNLPAAARHFMIKCFRFSARSAEKRKQTMNNYRFAEGEKRWLRKPG
jgi:hypothetical protein